MLSGLVFTTGCFEETDQKSKALKRAQVMYENQIAHEAKTRIREGSPFKDSYQETILERTRYEVEIIEKTGQQNLTHVHVIGIPYKVRKVLIDIINKNKDGSQFSFNVPDALRLILQQMNEPPTGSLDKTYKF